MTTIDLQTEIVQLIKEVKDTSILEQVKAFLRERLGTAETDDEYTDEDIAELDRRREERLQGKVPSHSMEESLRLAREGFKG